MKISDKDIDNLIGLAISQTSDSDADDEPQTDEELRSKGSHMHAFSITFEKQMVKVIREL